MIPRNHQRCMPLTQPPWEGSLEMPIVMPYPQWRLSSCDRDSVPNTPQRIAMVQIPWSPRLLIVQCASCHYKYSAGPLVSLARLVLQIIGTCGTILMHTNTIIGMRATTVMQTINPYNVECNQCVFSPRRNHRQHNVAQRLGSHSLILTPCNPDSLATKRRCVHMHMVCNGFKPLESRNLAHQHPSSMYECGFHPHSQSTMTRGSPKAMRRMCRPMTNGRGQCPSLVNREY